MKKYCVSLVFICAVIAVFGVCPFAGAADDATTWSIGGQSIKRTDGPPAKLPSPVEADALVRIPGATGQMIINIYPSDAAGNVANTASPKIILASGSDSFKLNQTMDNSKLAPGTYLMNAMVDNKTNRVVFTVK